MMFAGTFNYALVGLTVQSAFKSAQYSNFSAWLAVQDTYEQQFIQIYDRIFALDQLLLNNQLVNA